jgi:hypothetical protein
VKAPNCGATPVAKQFQLVKTWVCAVRRRSSRRTAKYIGGYLPPAELVKALDDFDAKQKKGFLERSRLKP